MTHMLRFVVLVGVVTLASGAHADPCQAVPDSGPIPSYLAPGKVFTGPVVYVADGDSLCVSVGQGARNWVEVRIADFYAPELRRPGGRAARDALVRIAMGRTIRCVADHRSYDRIVASCTLGGVSLGSLMRRNGVPEGGNGR